VVVSTDRAYFQRRLERKPDDVFRRRITLVLDDTAPALTEVLGRLTSAQGIRLTPAEYDRHVDARRIQIAFRAHVPPTAGGDLPALLESQPGVRRVRIEVIS
jgi:hypothetical protein